MAKIIEHPTSDLYNKKARKALKEHEQPHWGGNKTDVSHQAHSNVAKALLDLMQFAETHTDADLKKHREALNAYNEIHKK